MLCVRTELGNGKPIDDAKAKHVGCNYNDIRAHIIAIILYMLGLGEVMGILRTM